MKIKEPTLGWEQDDEIGICMPVYNTADNPNLATAVWSIEQCCDLKYQLSLGVGKNGVAKNRNKALARLVPHIRFVVMMDDDVIVSPFFASKMVAWLEADDGKTGAVSAIMQGYRGEPQNNLHSNRIGPQDHVESMIPGTFFMYDRDKTPIEWDENYQGSQWEDTDAMMQVRNWGYRTIGVGDVQIVHKNTALVDGIKPPFWDENKAYFEGKWGKGVVR